MRSDLEDPELLGRVAGFEPVIRGLRIAARASDIKIRYLPRASEGVVIATQNPMDLDYRALSNAGLWWIGRKSSRGSRPGGSS